MSFDRNQLPEPQAYFESQGLVLTGRGKWRTTRCEFHDGSDSMRVNIQTGGWVCMACGEHGGDVLAYEMQHAGLEFVDAAKALGAWVDDGKAPSNTPPVPLPPRAALSLVAFECIFIAMVACDLSKGKTPNETDKNRLLTAVGRVNAIAGAYA